MTEQNWSKLSGVEPGGLQALEVLLLPTVTAVIREIGFSCTM